MFSYDDLGRPSGNTITSGSNVISSADTYTLQGWLVNHSVQLNGNVQFSETLSYDIGSSASHTGLIVRKQESQRNGAFPRALLKDYSYDYAGRLSYESDGALASSNRRNFSYDGRGNVSSVINFTSNISQTPTQNYHYDGDRLASIDDVSLGHVLSSCSFTHDNLGRMTYDGLSDLDMEYNHLDLPRKVISGSTTLVNYSYLADGTKTSSLKEDGSGLVYRGPFVYRRDADGALTFESAVCPEGRLTPGKALLYVTNHLGSVRYVIDGNTGAQLENSDYTAYGTRSGSTPSAGTGLTFRDHFTGQEDQMPDFGIPYNDHGVRHYNPALLRWMVPDPLSEKYYGQSPYAYCNSNPVNFVDLDGEAPRVYIQNKGIGHVFITTGENANTTVYTYGRYGMIPQYSNGLFTLGKISPIGEGVLYIYSNNDAAKYLSEVCEEGNFSVFEMENVDEKEIDNFYNSLFSASSITPSDPQKNTFNDRNARVIDNYHIISNNCTTKAIESINNNSDTLPHIFSPHIFKIYLEHNCKIDSKIKKVDNSIEWLNSLISKLKH